MRVGLAVVLALAVFVPGVSRGVFAQEAREYSVTFGDDTRELGAGTYATLQYPIQHLLVQFYNPLSPTDLGELERLGVVIHRYIHHYAVIATITEKNESLLKMLPIVRATEALRAADKAEARLLKGEFSGWARNADGTVTAHVRFYKDVPFAKAIELLRGLGMSVEQKDYFYNQLVIVGSDPSHVKALAEKDEVYLIEEKPTPATVDNQTAAINSAVDMLDTAPFNLTGAGINVAIWDGGEVDDLHPDFGGRVSVQETSAVDKHATHVAGTVAGSGANDPTINPTTQTGQARGMAPGVTLFSFDAGNAITEKNTAYTQLGIQVDNNSWGYITGWFFSSSNPVQWYNNVADFGSYTEISDDWDLLAFNHPDVTIVNSAGNDRDDTFAGQHGHDGGTQMFTDTHPHDGTLIGQGYYDLITLSSTPKNIITVGASTDTNGMTGFSNWGPVNDGRIKPDIVANGEILRSTWLNSGYNTLSGTSMSAPVVTGGAALIAEQFRDSFGVLPRSATVKGLFIHTARDIDGTAGPSYSHGYGLAMVRNAVDLIRADAGQGLYIRQGETITTGVTNSYTLTVTNAALPLVATVVWTDPAGQPDSTAIDLVHDLDLVLIDPNGNSHFPWRLDGASPTNAATQNGPNTVDNVEKVEVNQNSVGTWTAQVKGTRVNGTQEYTVIFSEISGLADSDGDGLSDNYENRNGLNPNKADTDGDGLTDGSEVYSHGTDPTLADTDRDGLSDGDEVNVYHTSPLITDTDGDGLQDGKEIEIGTDPLVKTDVMSPIMKIFLYPKPKHPMPVDYYENAIDLNNPPIPFKTNSQPSGRKK